MWNVLRRVVVIVAIEKVGARSRTCKHGQVFIQRIDVSI